MKLESVIDMLKKEYEKAVNMKHIRKPMAYAIYRVWKEVDRGEMPRKVDDYAD